MEHEWEEHESDISAALCANCVVFLRSHLGADCNCKAVMDEKETEEELAQDLNSALAAFHDEETVFPAHHVGKRLLLGFMQFTDYSLKTHQSILKKFRKTPRQCRLKPLKLHQMGLKKKAPKAAKTMYALRKSSKTLRVYELS